MILRHFLIIILTLNLLPAFAQQFEEVTIESGINHAINAQSWLGGGMAWFDYNNDGWEDLYITGCRFPDALFKNNGDGTFTDVSESSGTIFTSLGNTFGVVTGDIDNDGDRDVFVSIWNSTNGSEIIPNILLLNNGNGTFTDISEDAGITEARFSTSACFLDIDGDSYLDIYVGNYVASSNFITDPDSGEIIGFDHSCYDDLLYVNNGDLTFTELATESNVNNNGCTLAVVGTDYDQDSDSDILVANDFGAWVVPNVLFENQLGSFTDASSSANVNYGIYAMGIAAGDMDGDLDFDYYMTNLGDNILLKNNEGIFEDVAGSSGVSNGSTNDTLHTGWGTFLFDMDNDKDLDLYVSNGHISTIPSLNNFFNDQNKLFRNDGDLSFTDVTFEAGAINSNVGRGCAFADYDCDGRLDFGICNIINQILPGDDEFELYRNTGTSGNYLQVSLEGTISNRDAYGSRVKISAQGEEFIRELRGGSSHASQNTSILHFGLGEFNVVDSLWIFWPSGIVQVITDIAVNQKIEILEEIPDNIDQLSPKLEMFLFPNPAENELQILLPGSYMSQVRLLIVNSEGKVVFMEDRTPDGRLIVLSQEMNRLIPGEYVIQVIKGQEKLASKFIKIR